MTDLALTTSTAQEMHAERDRGKDVRYLVATVLIGLAACSSPSTTPVGPQPPATDARFTVALEQLPIAGLPALHSYALGRSDGKWLVVGGRQDGLHKRRPFEAFLVEDSNADLHVIDVATATVRSAPVSSLAPAVADQLRATNLEFAQRGDRLYVIGGYGYSTTTGDHVTHGVLTAIDVPAMIAAIVANAPLAPHIRQLADDRLAVTGGYLGELDGLFYLAGGQRFTGRYNPMGPGHGPGFVQEYTNEIRRFRIEDDGTTLAIAEFEAWHDDAHLHRRDYNMVPQIFPDGAHGFTMFSGVFQHDRNLPWLDTVDVRSSGFQVVPAFEQRLSHYHTAHAALFEAARNEMHTIFFGGMAQYSLDATGALIEDLQVPFVRTISMITRADDGSLREFALGEMPALLGAGAEFIPNPAIAVEANGVQRLGDLPPEGIDLGFILGGIESSAPNVFFSDRSDASAASARLFRVTLNAGR